MRKRTDNEIEAYVDGYRASFEDFCKCLKDRKSVNDSIRKMRLNLDSLEKVIMFNERSE